jgi:dihydropteroate synthase
MLNRPIDGRLMGTAGAVAVAIMKGARMVRVHDVAPIRDVVRMIEAIGHAGLTPQSEEG